MNSQAPLSRSRAADMIPARPNGVFLIGRMPCIQVAQNDAAMQ
ncbi:MAG: hypothetical protein Q8Q81_17255 [Oxalobacteraceae bacterium]|nr:hypothetical protein [Oxalobacteraceae bacterium]